MNQPHNDDITYGQSADDWNNESHKMMSWMQQMMSQHQQVVETTPGQSQKLSKTSETVNLTEKSKALKMVTRCNTMMEKTLFWVPC